MSNNFRIAAFGFRSIPPKDGSAGADKFVYELYTRLIKLGCDITAYNRLYKDQKSELNNYKGIKLINFNTLSKAGFDTLWHSFLSTFHIIIFNTGNVVHIQNGGNSIWALILRLFGKKVFISQDGLDWNRDKWSWYAKIYLRLSIIMTSFLPNKVICDNIFVKKEFQELFKTQKNRFLFIPFGSEISYYKKTDILRTMNLNKKEYILFIGRFIPDKGLHYLIEAYQMIRNPKYKLVLIGGAPNPSNYEIQIYNNKSENILMPGFLYGDDLATILEHTLLYIQPSDIEGLSPMILQVLGMGVPLLCSDIKENLYIVKDEAITFKKSNVSDLYNKLIYCLDNKREIMLNAKDAAKRIKREYNWDDVAKKHMDIFYNSHSIRIK